ncbi:MAG: 2-isopropylmalate synthase [Candidatus Hermodarchaeota archaeon]
MLLDELEADGLIVNFNKVPQTKSKHLPKEVLIWDETLRDGEQTPGTSLLIDEKIEIAKLMDEMGVAIINVGFPAVSKDEQEVVRRIAAEGFKQAKICAPARAIKSDIDVAIQSGAEEVPIFIAFSNLHLKYKLKKTPEEALNIVTDCVEYAKKHGVIVDFVTEDTSRTSIDNTVKIFKTALEAGADRVVITDTVGFLRPESMRYLVSQIRDRLYKEVKRKVPLSIHNHNDFGLATATTLAAIEEGVTVPHVCVAGFGERAGNAPLEEVVMALEILYGVRTGINTERIQELADLVSESFAILLPVHKAITGENAFSHEAGIHVHGILSHRLTYEPIPAETVGRKTEFYMGKHTGSQIVKTKLEEKNINATEKQIKQIVSQVKETHKLRDKVDMLRQLHRAAELLRETRLGLKEDEFWDIVKAVTGKKPKN